jgi:hypothetical protein
MIRNVVAGMAVILALAVPAVAAPAPQGVNKREHREAQRIREGWRDGSLTRAERHRLVAEQAGIRAEERVYRRNGLNAAERKDLQRDLNRASRDIYRQKHDAQRRTR